MRNAYIKNARYVEVIAEFFNTTYAIDFSRCTYEYDNKGSYLGFNDDNVTSNGCFEKLAETAPTITDGTKRTLQFAKRLKEAEWSAPYIAQLQEKGYTIA